MKLENCKPGTHVFYSPITGQAPRYRGVVREMPWQLGHGVWVTHLHQMEPAYRDGKHTTVHAAGVADLVEIEATEAGLG